MEVRKSTSEWHRLSSEAKRRSMLKRKENRANQSEEAREESRRRDREAKKLKRASLSQSELQKRREAERLTKRQSRRNRSLDKLLKDRAKDRKRQAVKRLERELDGLDVLAKAALDSVGSGVSTEEVDHLVEHLLVPASEISEFFSSNASTEDPQVSQEVSFARADATHVQTPGAEIASHWQRTIPPILLSESSSLEEADTGDYRAVETLEKNLEILEKPDADATSKIDPDGGCVRELWETPAHGHVDVAIPCTEEQSILDFDAASSWESDGLCLNAEEFSSFLEEDECRERAG